MTFLNTNTPSGFVMTGYIGGSWVDLTPYTTRQKTVTITRAGISNPQTFTVNLWKQGGFGFTFPDFMPIRVVDPYLHNPTYPASTANPYIRYFSGFALNLKPTIDGNANEAIEIDAVGWDYIIQNPPARPATTLTVGVAPQWLPTHPYLVGDIVTSFPDCGRQYINTQQGTSGPTQPADFDGVIGEVGIIDGTCQWAEDGSSSVSDVDVWNILLPIYYPAGQITYGANLSKLIASVPSFQVDPSMTPDDVAKKLASLAGNRSYYATYPTWQANHVYTVGDEMELTTSVHGIIFKVQSVAGDAKSAASAHNSDFTVVTALGVTVTDNHVTWVSERYTGRWEASITMTVGQRIEPQTGAVNGYWYQVQGVGGTTAGTPPGTWSTTIGATLLNGSVTLMVMGLTAIQPAWQLWTPSDNSAHTASWTPDFAWFDANSMSQVLGVEYSDQLVEDSTHLHYGGITVNREGAPHRNLWYVGGKNGAFAVVPNTSDQSAILMTISQYYSDTSDTGPSTPNECFDLGQRLNAASVTSETVQITSHQVTDPVMIQKLSIGAVTCALLGLGSQQYQASQVSVTLGLGLPQWSVNFGAGFSTGQQDPLEVVLGRPYAIDRTPPVLVVWDNTPTDNNYFLYQNVVDPRSHLVSIGLQWVEASADTDHFIAELQVTGEIFRRRIGLIYYPTQSVIVPPSLPLNTVCQAFVAAVDHEGNVLRNADGTPQYSASPTFTTANLVAPHAPVTSLGTPERNQYGYRVPLTVTKNNSLDDASHGGWIKYKDGTTEMTPVGIKASTAFPYTQFVGALLLGHTYYFRSSIVNQYDVESADSAEVSYNVLTILPDTPSITGITFGNQGSGFYYADVVVASIASDNSGVGRVNLKRSGKPTIEVSIPANSTFPYTARIFGLQLGDVCTEEAAIADQFGVLSAYATHGPDTVTAVHLAAPTSLTQTYNQYIDIDDSSQVSFSWVAPADPLGLGITGYKVIRTQNGQSTTFFPGIVLAMMLLMTPGQAYTVTVNAIDGNGVDGAVATITGTAAGRVYPELYNPSFENNEFVITPLNPKGWTLTNNDGTALWDHTTASDGSSSVKFQWSSGANSPEILSDFFRVIGGINYYFSADVKGSSADSLGFYCEVYLYDSSFTLIGIGPGIGAFQPLTTSWVHTVAYNLTVTPSNAYYAKIGIKRNTAVAGLSSWIDNLQFHAQIVTPVVQDLAITDQKIAAVAASKLTGTISDAQHGNRGGGSLHADATPLADGFMSAADKGKLNGITAGAAVASVSGTAPIASSGGTTPAISITAATGLAAGSMSATDKAKLDASASANTASVLVIRDAGARAQFADPSVAQDAATKNYVDTTTIAGSKGTSFPGSPATNQLFFRTDLGVLCYWDGSRWLGPEYELSPWTYYPGSAIGEISAAGTTEVQWTPLRSDFATRITRIVFLGYVNGTSGLGNSWALIIRTFTGTVNVQTTPQSTVAWAGTTFTRSEVTTINTQPATTDLGLEFVVTKTGSPGPLRVTQAVYVRNVYV